MFGCTYLIELNRLTFFPTDNVLRRGALPRPGDERPVSLVTERKKGLEEEGGPRSPAADRRWWGSRHLSGVLEVEALVLDRVPHMRRGRTRGRTTRPPRSIVELGKKEMIPHLTEHGEEGESDELDRWGSGRGGECTRRGRRRAGEPVREGSGQRGRPARERQAGEVDRREREREMSEPREGSVGAASGTWAGNHSAQSHPIQSLTPLYWERSLLVLVQYQGIGVAILNLNAMDIQTPEFGKHDSNSQFQAPISTSKWGISTFVATAHINVLHFLYSSCKRITKFER